MTQVEEILNQRAKDYGPAEQSFARTALMWTAVLGIPVTPQQVALCMICLKISREVNLHKFDNIDDIIGYASLLRDLPPKPV